jgi:hypothetical protein
MFSRTESDINKCSYRICQEGLELLLPYMKKQVLHCTANDLLSILANDAPFIDQLSKPINDALRSMRE